ncbi:MAG TPA: RagB/SusD family nutrient uptake outer membrane protein [Flavobacterium sp.]|jgi:hypothetical protein
MRNHIKILAILLGIMFLFPACESFVDVGTPSAQLSAEVVFNDAGTAEAALVNVYSKLQGNVLVTGDVSGVSILLGHYADELTYYGSPGGSEEVFWQNSLLPSGNLVGSLWNDSYNLIYSANAVIEGVEGSAGIAQADKDRLTGEALFLRAFIHFYLSGLYGSIPYVTTTDYRVNSTVLRIPVEEIYPLLAADLSSAQILLESAPQSADNVRVNVDAAKAMLARVYLYSQNWTAAEAATTDVISSPALTWVEDLNGVFLKGSTGTIWQLMPGSAGMNTIEAQNFIFESGPPPARALSESLVNAFEAGDLRKEQWIKMVSDGTGAWYHAFKYKNNGSSGTSEEYSIMLRLGEMYLIRAEARAQLGNLSGAVQDLDKIRTRAGLPPTAAATQQEMLQAVMRERRVELFTELGHRFFDLKRTGAADQVLSEKPGWDATDILWPLPANEMLLNQNLLPQNPGY